MQLKALELQGGSKVEMSKAYSAIALGCEEIRRNCVVARVILQVK